MIVEIFTTFLVVLLVIFAKIHVIPCIQIWKLKRKFKDEIETLIHYGPSLVLEERKNLLEDNDPLSTFRKVLIKNPKAKAIIYKNVKGKVGYAFLDPEHIKQVHQNPESFGKTEQNPIIYYLFEKSLLFQTGKEWQRQRQFLGKSFHFDEIKNYLHSIKEVTQNHFQSMKEQITNEPEKDVEIVKTCQKVTSEIVFRVFFGSTNINIVRPNGEKVSIAEELIFSIENFTKVIRSNVFLFTKYVIFGKRCLDVLPSKKEKELKSRFINLKETCNQVIQQRKEQLIQDPTQYKYNFLDLYLKEILTNKNQDIKNQEIIDNSFSLFFAGTDTTSNLAGCSIYYLAKYPEIQVKARQEVLNILSEKNQNFNEEELFNNLSYQDLSGMNLLNSILKETLRLIPPAPNVLSRECTQDIMIGKFLIKKGSPVNTYFISNQSNPLIYPNPEEFDPFRWMNQKEHFNFEKYNIRQNSFNFTPFSLGPRNCIGQHLAMIEAKCILTYLLLNFDILLNKKESFSLTNKLVYGIAPEHFAHFRIRKLN